MRRLTSLVPPASAPVAFGQRNGPRRLPWMVRSLLSPITGQVLLAAMHANTLAGS